MSRFNYISSTGESVQLDGADLFTGNGNEARGHSWAYTIDGTSTRNHRRNAREVKLSFTAFDLAKLDRLRNLADMDMSANTPGCFVVDGRWTQRGYISALIVSNANITSMDGTIKAVLLDGFWWNRRDYEFNTSGDVQPTGADLDFPYDYPHDFTYTPTGTGEINVPGIVSADIRLEIQGPAVSPTVTIGANAYTVNADVPDGAVLVVDGMNRTIEIKTQDGAVINAFSDGVRGDGLNGGNYIFQPLSPGVSSVSWDNSFNFTVSAYIQSSEPAFDVEG